MHALSSGRLARGLIVGDTVRCPLHHACFSLRTGEALRAPAFDPISRWRVEVAGDTVFVREKLTGAPAAAPLSASPESILIIGGGAAGSAAADMVRREGFEGPVTIVSADSDLPVDRPNLSKDYLAGEAQDDWLPIWSKEQYEDREIELVLGRRATTLDPKTRTVGLDDGSTRSYGALADRDRRRSGAAADSRRGASAGLLPSLVGRRPRDRRDRRPAPHARSSSAPASSASKYPRRCASAASRLTSSLPTSSRSNA